MNLFFVANVVIFDGLKPPVIGIELSCEMNVI